MIEFIMFLFFVVFPIAFFFTLKCLLSTRKKLAAMAEIAGAVTAAEEYFMSKQSEADAYSALKHAEAGAYRALKCAEANDYFSSKRSEADALLSSVKNKVALLNNEVVILSKKQHDLLVELNSPKIDVVCEMPKIDPYENASLKTTVGQQVCKEPKDLFSGACWANVQEPDAPISLWDAQALDWWNGKKTDYNGWIPTETGWYTRAFQLQEMFLEKGYLEKTAAYENIQYRTMPELRAILAERELKKTGNKTDLVSRIVENFDEDEIEDLFPIGKFRITKAGEAILDLYAPYFLNNEMFLHFSPKEISAALRSGKNKSHLEVLKQISQDHLRLSLRNKDYGNYYYALGHHKLLSEKTEDYYSALTDGLAQFHEYICRIKLMHGSISDTKNYVEYAIPAVIKSITENAAKCDCMEDLKSIYLTEVPRLTPRGHAQEATPAETFIELKTVLNQ